MFFLYGQDANEVADIDVSLCNLEKGDTKFKRKNKTTGFDVFDFVGFSISNSALLTVFPKNFYSNAELSHLNQNKTLNREDVTLLFQVFLTYMAEEEAKSNANKYFGKDSEFYADYPFMAFYEVYDYFRKYGIYKEKTKTIKANGNGNVSWKKTIQKSDVIINEGNLLFTPLYTSVVKKENVFLSECMAFVIDHTIKNFSMFISLPQTGLRVSSYDFLKSSKLTIERLKKIQGQTFKDTQKNLVGSLIRFFQEYNYSCKGGNIQIKINHFNIIWEKMVHKYLNDKFSHFDKSKNQIICYTNEQKSSTIFESKEFLVDNSTNEFKIRLDHFSVDEKAIYIFDSKYYNDVSNLNYKQLAYNEIMRGTVSEEREIFSVLILPCQQNSSKIHFSYNDHFVGSRKNGLIIIEQYFSIRKLMQHYIT